MPRPSIWLAGDSSDRCFAPAVRWLAERSSLRGVESLGTARQWLRSRQEPPAAIVVCGSRPGSVAVSQVTAFQRDEPLVPLTLLLGSWCEGEVRSGRTAPGTPRIYWHQWQSRLPSALGLENSEERGYSLRPMQRTANEADRLELSLISTSHAGRGLVAICTRRAATFEMLAEAVVAGGYRATWQLPNLPLQSRGADVLLWDGWPCGTLHAQIPPAAKLAQMVLLSFPRWEDRERALKLGIREVISQPFQLPDLWASLRAACQGDSLRVRAEAAA
jgi:hypothetical protein